MRASVRRPAPTVTAADPAQIIVEHHVTHRAVVPDHPRRQPAHRERVVKTEPTGAVLAATATATQPAYDSILLLTGVSTTDTWNEAELLLLWLSVAVHCTAVSATTSARSRKWARTPSASSRATQAATPRP